MTSSCWRTRGCSQTKVVPRAILCLQFYICIYLQYKYYINPEVNLPNPMFWHKVLHQLSANTCNRITNLPLRNSCFYGMFHVEWH
jgi:hypothetical protein